MYLCYEVKEKKRTNEQTEKRNEVIDTEHKSQHCFQPSEVYEGHAFIYRQGHRGPEVSNDLPKSVGQLEPS